VAKTKVVYVKLFHNFACQKLSKSANVLQSYSKNKSGTVFFLRHSVLAHINHSMVFDHLCIAVTIIK